MRAERLERPADDHEVLALLIRRRAGLAEERGQFLHVREVVAAGHGDQRLRPPPRRIEKVLVREVHMQQPQHLVEVMLQLRAIDGGPRTGKQSAVVDDRLELAVDVVLHGAA
jgi:hypothetical protein